MGTLTLDTITPDETPFCGTHHSQADIAGYVVVLTRKGQGKVQDYRVYGPGNYGTLVEDLHALRMYDPKLGPLAPKVAYDYARIDVLYVDGCRGIL